MSKPQAATLSLAQPPEAFVPLPSSTQMAAAAPTSGVRVVLGGPGSGKTEVLLQGVVKRLEAGSSLQRLAVITGSRSAAQGLRRQVMRRTSGSQVLPRVTTLHGLALGWLREFAPPDGGLILLRAPEQELRLRELLAEVGPGFWPEGLRKATGTREFARQLRGVLARARQLSMDPADVTRVATEAGDELFGRVGEFFEQYLTVTDFENALDYAELIYRARLLLTEPDVARSVVASTDAVLVDDVQGLDPAQIALLVDVAHLGVPLLALGDPQQRIHSFRGATDDAIPALLELPGAELIELIDGFRARVGVAEAVAAIRRGLDARVSPPPPRPISQAPGSVTSTVFDDGPSQIAHVATGLRRASLLDGVPWGQLAVVVRSGNQLSEVSRGLIRNGIPVEVSGDELALPDQNAVRVLLQMLTATLNLKTLDKHLAKRIAFSPAGGLDGVGERRLIRQLQGSAGGSGSYEERPGGRTPVAHRDTHGRPDLLAEPLSPDPPLGEAPAPQLEPDDLIRACLTEPELLVGVESREAERLRVLSKALHQAAGLLAASASIQEVLWCLWDGTDWPQQLKQRALAGSTHANHDLDAMIELLDLAQRRRELAGAPGARTFLNEVAGEEIPADTGRELDLTGRGVRVLTAHRTAGEQWRRVWIVDVQEGRWPQTAGRGLLLDPERLAADRLDGPMPAPVLAPERRLFYVAASRASEELHVSAREGIEGDGGRPSRFLSELGVDVQRVEGRPGDRMRPAELAAEFRRAAMDEQRSEALRRTAALSLAKMARFEAADQRRPFAAVHPASWWGVRQPSSQPKPPAEILRISGSQLERMLQCPRRWFLSRRARAEEAQPVRASLGELVHELAKKAVTEGLTLDQVGAELHDRWTDIPFETNWLSRAELKVIEPAMGRFMRWHEATADLVLGVEKGFEVPLEVAGRRIELVGTVDRLHLVDGRLQVVDLKTGRKELRPGDVRDNPQLGLYQLAASLGAFDELAPGVRQLARPGLLQLRFGQTSPKLVEQPDLDSNPELAGEELQVGPTWIHDRLARAVQIMDSAQQPAVPGDYCSYCPFQNTCPAHHPLRDVRS